MPKPAASTKQRVAVVGPQDAALGAVETALMQTAPNRFTLVDRLSQELLEKEKTLQTSGDFGDTETVSLGQQWGAQIIVVLKDQLRGFKRDAGPGSAPVCVSDSDGASFDNDDCKPFTKMEDVFHQYFIDLRAVDVETGEVVGTAHVEMYEQSEGFTCLLDCTKEKAAALAVRTLLGVSP